MAKSIRVKQIKRFCFCAIALIVLLIPIATSSRQTVNQLVDEQATFVHLFEWTWDDVAQECETVLGPNGFAAVQVSPASEHVVLPDHHFPWWQRYQPVSYQLHSRSGDRTQFASMVARCHAAGVKVYADVVINHMAANQGVGSGGTSFQKYHYPGLFEPHDFHSCKQVIQNYQNHYEVTHCELLGLPDLDTSIDSVQQTIADHLLDLINLGVDGFRIDAAKHIHAHDLHAILQRVNQAVEPDPYIYQEVIDPGYEAVRKHEYYANGRVIEFEYGRLIGAKFLGIDGQTLAQLQTLGDRPELMPSQQAIVFIDNHDKQRGHAGGGSYLTHNQGTLYDLATVFMLAYPYGTPQVMSSYAFDQPDQGPPSDRHGRTLSAYVPGQEGCASGWICEHRRPAIAAMVGFRHAVAPDARVTNWWSNGRNQIAFSRGNQGFVAINREADPLIQTFQTGLPVGTYCNVAVAQRTSDRHQCLSVDAAIAVNASGEATLRVEGMSAIALHRGQKLD